VSVTNLQNYSTQTFLRCSKVVDHRKSS